MGFTPDQQTYINNAIKAAVQAAVGKAATITYMMATVASRSLIDGVASVIYDDDPKAKPAPVQILGPSLACLPGDRVMVARVPPSGSFIVGAPNGGYENWHVIGGPGEPTFANGWANQSVTPPPFTAGFRRDGMWLAMRGVIDAPAGITPPSVIAVMPQTLAPRLTASCYVATLYAAPQRVDVEGTDYSSFAAGSIVYYGNPAAVDRTAGGYLVLSGISFLLG